MGIVQKVYSSHCTNTIFVNNSMSEDNPLFKLLYNVQLKQTCVLKIEGFHLLPTLIYLQCSFICGDINNHREHGICTVILITFLLPQ